MKQQRLERALEVAIKALMDLNGCENRSYSGPRVNKAIAAIDAILHPVEVVSETKQNERVVMALKEMMSAYERRIRSLCTSKAELDLEPWRCAEFVVAENILREVFEP